MDTKFNVFEEPVEVLLSKVMTGGRFSVVTQTCEPGGGPPPHWHDNEDEFFMTLEGEFELFDGEGWKPLPKHAVGFKLRGQVHTFRNCGTTSGKILCLATPGALDEYLRAIAPLHMPEDLGRLIEISTPYGIHFLPPPPGGQA